MCVAAAATWAQRPFSSFSSLSPAAGAPSSPTKPYTVTRPDDVAVVVSLLLLTQRGEREEREATTAAVTATLALSLSLGTLGKQIFSLIERRMLITPRTASLDGRREIPPPDDGPSDNTHVASSVLHTRVCAIRCPPALKVRTTKDAKN